jgi:7-cyano-7-deazaguanine synthase
MPVDPRGRGRDAAVLVSGGLDSAVLTVDLIGDFRRVFPIYVRFGLRWEQAELAALGAFLDAVRPARPGLMPLTVLDEPVAEVYGTHWSSDEQVAAPGAETDDEAVYLPGRNVLLVAKTAVWCRLRGVETLALGTLAANPFPDSTAEFFRDFTAVLNRALGGGLSVVRPYAGMSKEAVIHRGAGLPLHLTLSCLDPSQGLDPCGACNKCAERHRAFARAGVGLRIPVPDRTVQPGAR